MNREQLNKKWGELSEKSFIYTKHNCIDVYNSKEVLGKLKKKAFNKYLEEEKLTESNFEDIYKGSNLADRKIITNEININLKEDLEYVKFLSNKNKVNKYKSKAFEELTKEVFDKLFNNLEGEDSFKTIFDKIELEIKENPKEYREIKQGFDVYEYEENKNNLKSFKIKNLNISFPKKKFNNLKKSYVKGDFLSINEIESNKKYIFEIKERHTALRLSRNKNLFFYKENQNNEIKYLISSNFEKSAKDLNDKISKGESFTFLNSFCIVSTFKDFLIDYYVKSNFLKDIEQINKSHKDLKIPELIKAFPIMSRPDMWSLDNKDLVFFEIKFNEFTELKLSNLQTTYFYVKQFNKICELNKIKLKVNEINLIHINNLIDKDIKSFINAKSKEGYKFNLINFREIFRNSEQILPNRVIVKKDKYKTIRSLENSLDDKNIILDLTNVT